MRHKIVGWCWVCAAVSVVTLPAAAQVPPHGTDFGIAVQELHRGLSVAVHAQGNFAVAWGAYFGDFGVRTFDRDGGAQGLQILDPGLICGDRPIHVTDGEAGSYVVIWSTGDPSGPGSWVKAVLLDRDASLLGTPFVVGEGADLCDATEPHVAVAPDGTIAAVWTDTTSNGTDASGTSIQARLFDRHGWPYLDRVQVNTTTAGDQRLADIAALPHGGYVVVWVSDWSSADDQSGTSIQAQRLSAAGHLDGAEIQVNSHTLLDQSMPGVAATTQGEWVVVWESESSGGDDVDLGSIQKRRFLASGSPAGPDFQVNTNTDDEQRRPAVEVMAGGAFEVLWDSVGSPGDDWDYTSVQRRAFTSDGAPAADQEQVNTMIVGGQGGADLAMTPHGDFVAVWSSSGWPCARSRLYRSTFFVDGFETGNVSVWSVVVSLPEE